MHLFHACTGNYKLLINKEAENAKVIPDIGGLSYNQTQRK